MEGGAEEEEEEVEAEEVEEEDIEETGKHCLEDGLTLLNVVIAIVVHGPVGTRPEYPLV